MKKSLIAAAVLGTFAASAFAAPNVVLYGRMDTSLVYSHMDYDQAGVDDVDTLSMESGWTTGSRWGLKGTEDLGNGVKVGFVLENGFSGDKGTLGQGSRLFGRESRLYISSDCGTLSFGRHSSIMSDSGSYGLLDGLSVFGNAYGDIGTMQGSTGSAFARYDNSILYASPNFAGFGVTAMYSFKGDENATAATGTSGKENSRDVERYAALAFTYKTSNMYVFLGGDYTLHDLDMKDDVDDGYSIILGARYDFGPAAIYGKVTYFDNQNAGSVTDSFDLLSKTAAVAIKGWGAELGVKAPLGGGAIFGAVGYRDAEDVLDSANEFKRWNVGVGYSYPFSKRTNMYAAVGYAQEKSDMLDATPSTVQAGLGLVHKF